MSDEITGRNVYLLQLSLEKVYMAMSKIIQIVETLDVDQSVKDKVRTIALKAQK